LPCGGKVPRLACGWPGCGDGCGQRLALTSGIAGEIGMLSQASTDTNAVLHLTC